MYGLRKNPSRVRSQLGVKPGGAGHEPRRGALAFLIPLGSMLTCAACLGHYGREGDRQVFGRRRHVHRAADWHGRL